MRFGSEYLTNPLYQPGRYLGRPGRPPQHPMSALMQWLGQNRLLRDLDRSLRFMGVDGDFRAGDSALREIAVPCDGLEQPAILRPVGDSDPYYYPKSMNQFASFKESPERLPIRLHRFSEGIKKCPKTSPS